jgi:hypothetical protein
MKQAVKKFLFAVSISLALAITGVANTQGFGQERKPPERPKEKDKEQPRSKDDNKDRRNDEKKNDDKKGGEKKKP